MATTRASSSPSRLLPLTASAPASTSTTTTTTTRPTVSLTATALVRLCACLFVCLSVCVCVCLLLCLVVYVSLPSFQYFQFFSTLLITNTPPPPAEMCKKYIIIFLRALHRDQEEALLNAKINADTSYLKRNAPMFLKLNLPTTINLLAKIVENSSGEDAWLMHQGVVGAPGGWLVHQGVVGWLSG